MAEQKNVFSFVKINISFLFQSVSVIIRISLSRKNTKMGATSTQNILSYVSFQAKMIRYRGYHINLVIYNQKFVKFTINIFTNEYRFLKFSSLWNHQAGVKFATWWNFSIGR